MITMNKLIWIICCCYVVVDASYLHCEIPDDQFPQHQGQKGQKGEASKSCDCSKLEKELSDLKKKPRDCYDVLYYNPNSTSGLYRIFPSNYRPEGIEVFCDMDTDGGGWIVFQNRQDGSIDFYRGWKEYLIGFGNLTTEFWLGLEYIHQLTKYGTFDLRIDMTDFERNEAYAVYSSFSLGDEDSGYVLKFTDYFGDAGDNLEYHRNRKFTTFDKDQDANSGNCAVTYTGAWWFGSCFHCSLNGQYLEGPVEPEFHGKDIEWKAWKGPDYSLKSTQMKIRPYFARYTLSSK